MSFLILLTCLFVQIPSDVPQQGLMRKVELRFFDWEADKPQVVTGEIVQVQTPKFYDLIQQKEVRKEIEVSADQEKKLQKWLQSIWSFQARWMRQRDEIDKQKSEDFKKQLEDLDEELVEILVPLQFEEVKKIKNRVLLRRYGWKHFLKTLNENGTLKLDAKELKSISDQLDEMRHEVDVVKLLDDVTTDLFAPYSEIQQSQIKRFCENHNVEITHPDLFLAQSKYALRDLKVKFGVQNEKEFRELLIKRPSFNFYPDGSFKSQSGGLYAANFAHFVANLSSEERDLLELDEDQRSLLGDSKSSFWNTVKAAQKIRNAGEVTEEINDVFVVKMEDARNKFENDTIAALNERQIIAVRSEGQERYAKQFGLIALILYGDLGRDIKLTKKQEGEFRETASEQIEKIEKQLIDWDNDLLARIHRQLSPENRGKLDELIGRKLTYVVPTFEMILQQ